MSTEIRERAREIIEVIAAQVDDEQLMRRFDDPIGMVVRQFDYHVEYPMGHRAFNRTIARLVEHIYARGLRCPTPLIDPLAEAISLLDDNYQSNAYGPGYIAAMLDAADGANEGMHGVVVALGESIKDRERSRHVKGVFASHVPIGDWHLQCEIVRTLLEDYKAVIPERLRQCAPAQLVDQIPSILYGYIRASSVLRNISF
jgi:GT2 family glycosyltransferase